MIFGLVIISINISVPFWFTSSDSNDPDEYSLTDTVIVPYTKFCSNLQIESKDSVQSVESDSTATLYLLSKPPPLSAHENFTHNHSIHFTRAEDAQVWSLNLHPGSTIAFESCYVPVKGENSMKKGVVFYLIKGDENYNNWVDEPNDSYSVQHIELNTRCDRVSYQVFSDDIYYLAFFNTMDVKSTLSVHFKINRTKYQVSPDTVKDNCTIAVNSHSSCSLKLPITSSYTALLELNTSPPIDWDDGVTIDINCLPRGWLYAVIVVGTVLLLTTFAVTVLVMCVCTYLKRRGRRKAYTTIPNSEPSISVNSYGRPPVWWYRSNSPIKNLK